MEANNNTKGIFFIMTCMAFFSIQDSLIKFIFEDIALFELYLGRTLIQATILLAFVIITKKHITLINITGRKISLLLPPQKQHGELNQEIYQTLRLY